MSFPPSGVHALPCAILYWRPNDILSSYFLHYHGLNYISPHSCPWRLFIRLKIYITSCILSITRQSCHALQMQIAIFATCFPVQCFIISCSWITVLINKHSHHLVSLAPVLVGKLLTILLLLSSHKTAILAVLECQSMRMNMILSKSHTCVSDSGLFVIIWCYTSCGWALRSSRRQPIAWLHYMKPKRKCNKIL